MATPRKRKHRDPLHLSSHGNDPTATWKPNLRPHHKCYSFSQRAKSTSVAAAAHGTPAATSTSTASYASGNPSSKGLRRFQRHRIANKSTPVTEGVDLEPKKSRLSDPRKKCNDGNSNEAKDPRAVGSGKAHGEEGLVPLSVAREAPKKSGNPAPPLSGNSELPMSSKATPMPRAHAKPQTACVRKPTVAPNDHASKPPQRRANASVHRGDASHGNLTLANPPAQKTQTLPRQATAAKLPIQTRTRTPAMPRKEATSVGVPSRTDFPMQTTTNSELRSDSKTVVQPRTEDPGRGHFHQRTLPSRKNLDRAQKDEAYGRNYRCHIRNEASLEAPNTGKPFRPATAASSSSSSSSSSSLTRANLLALSQQANEPVQDVSVVPLTSLCRSETQATTDVMGLSPKAAFLRRASALDEDPVPSGTSNSHPHPTSTLALLPTSPTLVRKQTPSANHRGIENSYPSYLGPSSPPAVNGSEHDSDGSYGHPSKRPKRRESSCQTQTPTRLLDKFNHVRTPEKPTKASAPIPSAKEFHLGTHHHYYSGYSDDEKRAIDGSFHAHRPSAKDSPFVDRTAGRKDAIPKFIFSGKRAPNKHRKTRKLECSTAETNSSNLEPQTKKKKKERFRQPKKRRSTDVTTRGTRSGKTIHPKAYTPRDRKSPSPRNRTKRGLDATKDGDDLRRAPTHETARRISLESPTRATSGTTMEPAYTRRNRPPSKRTKLGRKQAQTNDHARRVSLESPPTASEKRSVGHKRKGGGYQHPPFESRLDPSKLASSESDAESSDWSACWDNLSIGSKLRARYLSETNGSSSEESLPGTGDFRHDSSAEETEPVPGAPKTSLRKAYRTTKAPHNPNSRKEFARSKETTNPRHTTTDASVIPSNSQPAISERHTTFVGIKTISMLSPRSIRWSLFLFVAYALLWAGHKEPHHHRVARTSRGEACGCGTTNPHRIPPRIWFSENPSASLVELSMIHEATMM